MATLRHYTDEEAEQIGREALAIVERLAPPPELAPVLLEKMVTMLAAKTMDVPAVPILQPNGVLQ